MNIFGSESDTDSNIPDSTLSIIVAGEGGSDIALTPVDM